MLALAWYTGMAAVVTRARDFLNRDRVQRALRRATAAVFLGFGARLLTERT
jgi:threonine/homoserine/homoserine lactone efflux protein